MVFSVIIPGTVDRRNAPRRMAEAKERTRLLLGDFMRFRPEKTSLIHRIV
jgi:hypothetical protein